MYGICEIHVWSFKSLLDAIPDSRWLVKHNPSALEKSLLSQLWWQATRLSVDARSLGCDILFATDASTLCKFSPMVVMSQDMLSYEPGVMRSFGYTKDRFRLEVIRLVQNRALRRAESVIFLTQYAAEVVQQSTGPLESIACIPHGVDSEFKRNAARDPHEFSEVRPIRCIYVSPIWQFKHQWVVVEALEKLRKRGHNIALSLVGEGSGKALRMLEKQIASSDPQHDFVECTGHVEHHELPHILLEADVFIFASSCENLPISLLEAMAVGLPIACSNRGPMPEILQDGGLFFDPEDADSICAAVDKILTDSLQRDKMVHRAQSLSEQYTWRRCAAATWSYIRDTWVRGGCNS